MGATTLISLDEYLNTSYNPDRDFLDGVLVERNVGTQLHGLLQSTLVIYFGQFRASHRIKVFTETRLRVDAAKGRHRIPDVMLVSLPYQKAKVIVDVPVVVVEIKSPDDTFDDILTRCFDYEALGVPNILVMDPDDKHSWRFIDRGLLFIGESTELPLPGGRTLALPVAELFEELNQD